MADAIINSSFNESFDPFQSIQPGVLVDGTKLNDGYYTNAIKLSTVLNSIVGITIRYIPYGACAAILNTTTITDSEFKEVAIDLSGMVCPTGGGDIAAFLFYVSNKSEVYDLVAHKLLGVGKYLAIGNGNYNHPYSNSIYWYAMQIDS